MSFSVNYMCADAMPVHISTLVLAKILVTFSSVKFLHFTPIQYLRVDAIFLIFLERPSDKSRRDGEKRDASFTFSPFF